MHRKQSAFTLIEVAIVIAIMAILLGISFPYYFRYRAHQAINTAQEQVEGILLRAKEEARAIGLPLDVGLLTASGATAPNIVNRQGSNGDVYIRIRKRTAAQTTPEPQTIAERNISQGIKLEINTENIGKFDLDTVQAATGVYFEIYTKVGGLSTLLAVIPVDINGDMVLASTANNTDHKAKIILYSDDYSRELSISKRGAVTPDRR